MVKAYLRYEPLATLGLISSGATIKYTADGKTLVSAALESIHLWNVRTGERVATLAPPPTTTGKQPEVTKLALSPDGKQLAAGHSDGTIRLWNLESKTSEPPASGHTSGVSSLTYSRSGALLASGGQDTNVVVWDVTTVIPLHRLQGHSGQVTDVTFLQQDTVLASCSKDSYIRTWMLASQHCFQTLGGLHGEVWGLCANAEGSRLVVGYAEPILEAFAVDQEPGSPSTSNRDVLHSMGQIARGTNDRAAQLCFNEKGDILACLGSGKVMELFRVRSAADAKQHMKRRRKRKREKASKPGSALANGDGKTGEVEAEVEGDEAVVTAGDEFAPFQVIRSKSKIKALAFSPKKPKKDLAQLSLALSSNSIEVWAIKESDSSKQYSIDATGHRSGIRSLALASDDSLLLSIAETSAKIWNPRSSACIRHIDTNHGLCAMFAPGNRHAVVGTKEGTLDLIDVGSGDRIEAVEAHQGAVWAVQALPDKSGLVSGSADHEAKFWEWEVREVVQESTEQTRRVLGLRQTRTLRLSDDILAIQITPDSRLIALALLDSTVQVYFLDSLKHKGSLYGHKLPVLSMDISSDSTLLVTGSADKNIKIWGLDFNDCHKSIFAHNDSVMQITFVPNTHYVFSVSKDGLLKYWDADRWQLLLELPGHHAEVWCLAVSSLGDTIVTGSADRSIRLWERTDEPFFAEEEQENRIESLFEADQPNPHTQEKRETEGPAEAKLGIAGLDTPASRDAMGALADALDDAAKEAKRLKEHAESTGKGKDAGPAPPNPLLLGLSPSEYVLRSLEKIRAAALEQALLLLPFSSALELLDHLCHWLNKEIMVELACRVAVLLVRLHHKQLIATPSVRPVLARVRDLLHSELQKKKDIMGFNLAATNHLLRLIQDRKRQPQP